MSGYDENFLDGYTIPLPEITPQLLPSVLFDPDLREEKYVDHIHFTILMNREKRTPIYSALNVNLKQRKGGAKKKGWEFEKDIAEGYQLGDDYYYFPYQRGHLAMRGNAAWGKTKAKADEASKDTYWFTNATLQHRYYNPDEWLDVEMWVMNHKEAKGGKLTSISGPVHGPNPRMQKVTGKPNAEVPTGFFKVVYFLNSDGKLEVRAFIVWQDTEAMADDDARAKYDAQIYQVTVKEVEDRTGLKFPDEIAATNPMLFHDTPERRRDHGISHFPENIYVDNPEEIREADSPRVYYADDEIDVYITAALVNPKGRQERKKEWIGLANLGATPVDLAGWKLVVMKEYRDGDEIRSETLVLDEVLGDSTELAPGAGVAIKPLKPIVLSNSRGGTIVLYKPSAERDNDEQVDRVKYTKAQAKIQGQSIVFAYRRDQ